MNRPIVLCKSSNSKLEVLGFLGVLGKNENGFLMGKEAYILWVENPYSSWVRDGLPISKSGFPRPRFGLGFWARSQASNRFINFANGLGLGPFSSQKNRVKEEHLVIINSLAFEVN